MMVCEPSTTAFMPLAHTLFTAVHGTLLGMPAPNAAWLAGACAHTEGGQCTHTEGVECRSAGVQVCSSTAVQRAGVGHLPTCGEVATRF
jgi:hypothetical protein